MSLRSAILICLVAAFGLTACGKNEKKEAEGNVNEGQALINTINSENQKIWNEHSVLVSARTTTPTLTAQTDWSVRTPQERNLIRRRLTAQIARVNRVLELGSKKNMVLYGAQSLIHIRENSKAYLDSLNAYEQSLRGTTSPAPSRPQPLLPRNYL